MTVVPPDGTVGWRPRSETSLRVVGEPPDGTDVSDDNVPVVDDSGEVGTGRWG